MAVIELLRQADTGKERKLTSSSKRRKRKNLLYQGQILLEDGFTTSLPAAERFRMLRAKIQRLHLKDETLKTLCVTSAVPREGKSVVSVNLARALGTDPLGRTLILDCDLRKPSVHQFFHLNRGPGLSDLITGKVEFESVVHTVEEGLDVISAGSLVHDSAQIIDQPEFARWLETLRRHYRFIVIDSPPTLLCPEPITLGTLADATLIVTRAWRTPRRLTTDTINALSPSKILGIVMNDGSDASKEYLDYGYYGYSTKDKDA